MQSWFVLRERRTFSYFNICKQHINAHGRQGQLLHVILLPRILKNKNLIKKCFKLCTYQKIKNEKSGATKNRILTLSFPFPLKYTRSQYVATTTAWGNRLVYEFNLNHHNVCPTVQMSWMTLKFLLVKRVQVINFKFMRHSCQINWMQTSCFICPFWFL